MANSDETSARMTLKLAGRFQEARDAWIRRLDSYFCKLESLAQGQWFSSEDIVGIIRESRLASREALHGLGSDLSAELTHSSSGLIERFEAERSSMINEISDLRSSLSQALLGDENTIKRENNSLRATIMAMPEFQALEKIQNLRKASYKEISKASGKSISETRKLTKKLTKLGKVHIDKSTRPHTIHFVSAPWLRMPNRKQEMRMPSASRLSINTVENIQ